LTDGDMTLGGNAIDWKLLQLARDNVPGADFPATRRNLQSVREFKEHINTLSGDISRRSEQVHLYDTKNRQRALSLTGEDVMAACRTSVDRMLPLITDLIDKYGQLESKPSPVVRLLLLGGGSKMKAMSDLARNLVTSPIRHRFKLPNDFDPNDLSKYRHDAVGAVARGLARCGVEWRRGRRDRQQFAYYPRVPRPTGLAVVDDTRTPKQFYDRILYNSVHLEKHTLMDNSGSPMDNSDTKLYYLPKRHHYDEKNVPRRPPSVLLRFLMGGERFVPEEADEETKARFLPEAECIGEYNYQLNPPRNAADVELSIQYTMDADGIIIVRVRDMGFESTSDPKIRKAPDSRQEGLQLRLDFGALSDDETAKKRTRNLKIEARLPGED
jgi:hypothetical protein